MADASVSSSAAARRKMALHMARLRVAGNTARGRHARALPEALPCFDYEEAFRGIDVPMGSVVVTDAAQLQRWLLVARPVSRKEAVKKGGCIQFSPLAAGGAEAKKSAAKPQYFCITDTDDEVYGRAAYLPRTNPSAVSSIANAKKAPSSLTVGCSSNSGSSSCLDACTEEGEDDMSDLSETEHHHQHHRHGKLRVPRRNSSLHCVCTA